MFGADWSNPQTLWLNLTNLALGVVTLLALLVVAGGVGWELVSRRRRAREVNGLDRELRAYSLAVPGLGLTMADGGEVVKPTDTASPTKSTERK